MEVPAEVQPPAAQVEAVAASEPAKAEDHPVASDCASGNEFASIAAEARISEAEKAAGKDDEVMAAIDSLAPSNGKAIESLPSRPQGANGSGHQAHGSANHPLKLMLRDFRRSALTGPRWIAEAMAVAVEESKLALEQEMESRPAVERLRIRSPGGNPKLGAYRVPSRNRIVLR